MPAVCATSYCRSDHVVHSAKTDLSSKDEAAVFESVAHNVTERSEVFRFLARGSSEVGGEVEMIDDNANKSLVLVNEERGDRRFLAYALRKTHPERECDRNDVKVGIAGAFPDSLYNGVERLGVMKEENAIGFSSFRENTSESSHFLRVVMEFDQFGLEGNDKRDNLFNDRHVVFDFLCFMYDVAYNRDGRIKEVVRRKRFECELQ